MFGKIGISVLIAVAGVSIAVLASQLTSEPVIAESVISTPEPVPPTLSADSWGIFDPETGEILEGEQVHTVRPIASVTKLFTAAAVIENDAEDVMTIINWHDLDTEGRAGKLSHNDHITLGELLFPLLIESSNDAGEAIRRTLGSDFTSYLSEVKDSLDLKDTDIVDGSGLSVRDVSTVADLAAFYTHLRETAPRILDITQLPMYITDETGWVNNSPLHELTGYVGGKHGYTPEAGRTFVGAFELENGKEIGIVLLGSDDLQVDVTVLLRYVRAIH